MRDCAGRGYEGFGEYYDKFLGNRAFRE